jgi:hypothetical protein
VTLANGSRALLCACYDVFGVAEAIIGPTARIRYISSSKLGSCSGLHAV